MKASFWVLLSVLSLMGISASAQKTGSTGGGQPFDNRQPTLALRYIICTNGFFPERSDEGVGPVDRSEPLYGEIRAVAFDSPLPRNWVECNGQMIAISANNALFAIIGTTFGGDGRATFQLPDLRHRVPMGAGQDFDSPYQLGGVYGIDTLTLETTHLPTHTHTIPGGATGAIGAGEPFDNRQEALALNFLITQNGEIMIYPGNFAPKGWDFCDGSIFAIADQDVLFSYLGTTYGGDGEDTFQLPDMVGRVPMGVGQGAGLSSYFLGEYSGAETVTLSQNQTPSHVHTIKDGTTGATGGSNSFDNRQPALALNWMICTNGFFPSPGAGVISPWFGELRLLAGSTFSHQANWTLALGQNLPIADNETLFQLLGTMYGGDGEETFAIPDLRGRFSAHHGAPPGGSVYILAETGGSEERTLTVQQMPSHAHSLATPPSVACQSTIIANNIPGLCYANVPFGATVTGGNPAPVLTYKLGSEVITSPYSFALGTNIVSVTASNGILPNATCSFAVVVQDTEAPFITSPGPITVTSHGGYCPRIVTFTSTASDCGLDTVYSVPPSGSAFPVGSTSVTIYATDLSGNTNSRTFSVTVLPGPQPQLTYAQAGNKFILSWPTNFACYTLESAVAIPPSANQWTAMPGVVAQGGMFYLTNTPANTNRFFRLRY